MGKTLYLECASGISGDMTVAALLDLGADEQVLKEALASLPLSGYEIKISRVKKSGLDACDFDVILEEENHDHDMAYLHGKEGREEEAIEHGHHHHDDHEHDHHHAEGHKHDHDHLHGHKHHHGHEEGHGHSHVTRGPKEVREVICGGNLTRGAREMALRVFDIIARAEAKAHGVPLDQVHFHEVGAVDSIVDVVAAAVCLDQLGVDDVIVSPLTEGQGTVRCQHGILPIPVPAVAHIVEDQHLVLRRSPEEGEFVTPTGAAVAAAFRTGTELPTQYTILRTGLGAGKRDYRTAGVVRAMLIRESIETKKTGTTEERSRTEAQPKDGIWKLETNIDDSTGEELGFVMEELFRAGARDVFYQPIFMKKNRPAYLLHVICDEAQRKTLENIIFRETTTIGIRRSFMERTVLERSIRQVETPFGPARVKLCRGDEGTYVYPEYESVAAIARERKLPFREVFCSVQMSGREGVDRIKS